MGRKYDVFHLDGERGFRGGERQLLYLAAALRARGHRNTVVCRRGGALAREAQRLQLKTLFLPFLTEWDPLTALRLRSLALASENPILHAHTGHTAALAAMAGALRKLPHVVHRRVDFPVNNFLSRRLKYRSAGLIVSVSRAIRDILGSCGLDKRRIEVITDGIPVGGEECAWAGVDDERFTPPSAELRSRLRRELAQEFHIASDAPWVGNVAALVPHKDHDNLIAAAVLVLQKRPETIFLIAGEGPEGPRLLSRIGRLGLLGRVLLLGQRADPMPLLKTLDVFTLSSWGEGMGSVLLEAASCGVPIAATTAGGIPEIVEDGRSGLLAPPRDPEALAARILTLLEDRRQAAQLARDGLADLRRFGLGRMAKQMEHVYERATRSR